MRPLLAALLCLPATVTAQAFEFSARPPYRSEVPRPAALLGYEPGAFHTDYAGMERVVDAIARAAPGRVRVFTYGASEERRALRVVAVTHPDNAARLDQIRVAIGELTDPRRTTPARAREIASREPVIVWLNYANDGDESAAFEAALQVLWHFAASEDSITLATLRNAVVLINPAHNPESHERFVAWYNAFGTGVAERAALEHDAPWGMESNNNHYQIDLNRDALALTQRETRALVAEFRRWNPQVFVDHHGQLDRYFFAPVAIPVNPMLPPHTLTWLERFGRANGEAFDRHGWPYFVRDVFDLYYPGYWDSWPALNGATGMTYETDGGGGMGLAWRRDDGTVATLRGAIAKHYVASLTTVETAARHREERLRDYYDFRATGMTEARTARLKRVVLPPGADPQRALELAVVLGLHGIEVRRAGEAFTSTAAHDYARPEAAAARRAFPAGSLVIDVAQPQARLAATLLDPQPALDTAFARQELDKAARNARRGTQGDKEGDAFYDITAWALPLLYGVEAYWTEDAPPVTGTPLAPADTLVAAPPPQRARSAYLFPNDRLGATVLALRLAAEDFKLSVARRPLRADGRAFPRGTWVLLLERNPPSVHGRVAELAATLGVTVHGAQSAYADSGPVGPASPDVVPVAKPRIAVLAGDGVSETAYGALWYLLERRFGVPFTPFRAAAFGRLRLEEYNVLVLPHGGGPALRGLLRGDDLARLTRWVRDGGTLIAIRGAAAAIATKDVGLTSVRPVGSTEDETDPKGPAQFKPDSAPLPPSAQPGPPLPSPTAGEDREPLTLPGVVARATLDGSHWLTFGYGQSTVPIPLFTGMLLAPSREGENPVVFAGGDVILSGFAWPNNSDRLLQRSVYAAVEAVGSGKVVLFAGDPTFRAVTPVTWTMLGNAILMGPGR